MAKSTPNAIKGGGAPMPVAADTTDGLTVEELKRIIDRLEGERDNLQHAVEICCAPVVVERDALRAERDQLAQQRDETFNKLVTAVDARDLAQAHAAQLRAVLEECVRTIAVRADANIIAETLGLARDALAASPAPLLEAIRERLKAGHDADCATAYNEDREVPADCSCGHSRLAALV